jgi:multiple sugar transport system substrate-binding protein
VHPGPWSRRRVLAASVSLASTALLAACGGQRAATAPSTTVEPSSVELYVYSFNARQQDLFDSVVKRPFEQENRGYTLTYTVGGGVAKLITLVSAGTVPDATWWGAPETWTRGMLRKLNDFVARDKVDLKAFPQQTFKSWQMVHDTLISLPCQAGGNWPALPYNKDLFARAGVPEPPTKWGDPKWSWDAFLDVCRRLRTSFGGATDKWPMAMLLSGDYYTQAHPYLWKASWVSADWKTATPDTPEMTESFRQMADLVLKVQGAPKPGELSGANVDNFLAGKVAMFAQAPGGFLSQIVEGAKNGAPFALAALPTMKQTGSSINLDGTGLLKESKQPEQAWVLARWLASNHRWSVSRGTPPAKASLWDAWVKDYLGDLGSQAQQLHLDVIKEGYAVTAAMDAINMQPQTADIKSSILNPMENDIFSGKRSVEDALRSVKAPMQAMIQPVEG